jgi:hypothetical protein
MVRRWKWRSQGWTSAVGWAALVGIGACSVDSRELDEPGETATAGTSGAPGGAGGASSTDGNGGSVSDAGASNAGAGGATTSGAGGSAGPGGAGGGLNAAGAGAGDGSAGAENGGAGGAGSGECATDVLVNGGFESGEEGWVSFTTGDDPLIYDSTPVEYEGVEAHGGLRLAWLGGVPSETNRLSQAVNVPAGTTRLSLRYSLRVQIFEQHTIIDFLRVRLVVSGVATPIAEYSNANAGQEWVDYAPEPLAISTNGQPLPVTLEIESAIGDGPGTNFYVDDLALVPTCVP